MTPATADAPVEKNTRSPDDDSQAWHAMPAPDVLSALETDDAGLTPDEAARRLEAVGPNALPRESGNEALRILLSQVQDPLIYVLIGSTVLAILTGKLLDGAVIGGVVVLNAIIGFIQEYRANKAIRALTGMVPTEATTIRGGSKRALPATELVPGDLVLLQSGDKVPADMRLLHARSLKIEEAALTGESVPVDKDCEPVPEHTVLGDRKSMLYSGTLVTYGTARAVVVATGVATELGRISRMLGEAAGLETPLTRQLAVIAKWIALAIVIVSVVLFGVGMWRGYPLGDAVLAAVTLAVAAIPEGLPAIVTIALAIGVQRMARRRVIIRKLPAVETLGSTTVICSDKTGTLTRNEMTVQVLWSPEGIYRLSGVGYEPAGELQSEDGMSLSDAPETIRELAKAGVLCNDAALHDGDDGWRVTGDPTEGALVVAARKLGLDADDLRSRHHRIDAIPFESEHQFMATLHDSPDGPQSVYIKGAPEVVLPRCQPADDGDGSLADRLMPTVDKIAAEGVRVLAFARFEPRQALDRLHEDDVADGLTLLGLQGMIDPPRPEAIDAVDACHRAGITVKMITGDHEATAGPSAPIWACPSPVTQRFQDRPYPGSPMKRCAGRRPATMCSRAWHPRTSSASCGPCKPRIRSSP